MSEPRPSMRHRKATAKDEGLTKERMELLTRIYHTAAYAAEATGCRVDSITEAAKKHGLSFRQTRYEEQPPC